MFDAILSIKLNVFVPWLALSPFQSKMAHDLVFKPEIMSLSPDNAKHEQKCSFWSCRKR